MHLLRDLWTTAPRRTAAVACLVVLRACGQALAAALAGPVYVHRSGPLFLALAAALVTAVISDLVVGLVAAGLTADWSADVRRRLCAVSLCQDLPSLERTPVGELLDRIDGDVYQVASEMRGSGLRILQSVATGVVSVVVTLVVWWPGGVVMALLATLLLLGLGGRARSIAVARMDEEEAWSDLAAVTEESVHGQDDVRTSLADHYVVSLYARRASEVLRRGRVVWRLSSQVMGVGSAVTRAGVALLVVAGTTALLHGWIDGARLTAVWLLALAFGNTVEHVTHMLPEVQYALGAWGRVQQLGRVPQEPVGGQEPREGDLVVRGLTFHYEEGASRPALRDVHLTFTPGRSYAVVGRSGSGKSTLAKVLTRAVPLPRGTAFLAGCDLLDLDLEALRRWIAVVPQRTEILAGTLAENVALFDPALLDAVEGALRELDLDSWVAELPRGLDTRLGDGGHVLSAGQEQLVAVARVLVRDPRVVILDEATARMDPQTESRVQRAVERLLRGRIGIVVAHRLSSVRRCDEVVVLADGEVLETGPLGDSQRFARLLERSHGPVVGSAVVGAGTAVSSTAATGLAVEPRTAEVPEPRAAPPGPVIDLRGACAEPRPAVRMDPPPLPGRAPVRTLREILRLATNDARFGLRAVALFVFMVLLGLDGVVLPWLWSGLVDGRGTPVWSAVAIVAGLLLTVPMPFRVGRWFPEWWVRQMLRIGLRLVHGQTGPRRVSSHTPAEVVAQGGDTERVVQLADNLLDQIICAVLLVGMTLVSGTVVPALFFAGTMVLSGVAATLFGPGLERSAGGTVAARAAFATALVSCLSAARTVKLAGATRPVLAHLERLERVRGERQRREITVNVWSRSTPAVVAGLFPVGVWALYLGGRLPGGAALVAVSTLGAARWFAWTTASLISQLPSARVWTRRTVSMCGTGAYSVDVPGVDLSEGTSPAPPAPPRHPLERLELAGFGAVHEDGVVGASGVDLTVTRGQLVLVIGAVGSGKSSLLRALAGVVHHTGALRWNGRAVREPELFLRPNQVGYVAQVPRVLSGTVADNIHLGHGVDVTAAVSVAQLEHDLAGGGAGLGLLIGHKGARLSGGQLQRLALARALAPRTELLVADDVSSALDVTTELALWKALRERGTTVIGSTSKRVALVHADQVVVLREGRMVDHGTWRELEGRWGHLAG